MVGGTHWVLIQCIACCRLKWKWKLAKAIWHSTCRCCTQNGNWNLHAADTPNKSNNALVQSQPWHQKFHACDCLYLCLHMNMKNKVLHSNKSMWLIKSNQSTSQSKSVLMYCKGQGIYAAVPHVLQRQCHGTIAKHFVCMAAMLTDVNVMVGLIAHPWHESDLPWQKHYIACLDGLRVRTHRSWCLVCTDYFLRSYSSRLLSLHLCVVMQHHRSPGLLVPTRLALHELHITASRDVVQARQISSSQCSSHLA